MTEQETAQITPQMVMRRAAEIVMGEEAVALVDWLRAIALAAGAPGEWFSWLTFGPRTQSTRLALRTLLVLAAREPFASLPDGGHVAGTTGHAVYVFLAWFSDYDRTIAEGVRVLEDIADAIDQEEADT